MIIQQAIQYHQAGDLHQAETLYRQLLQMDPNHTEALHLLGVIALQNDHYDEAITLINQAIHLNKFVPNYHCNLGVAQSAKGHLDEASSCYRQALTLDPNYAEAHNNLGNVFQEQGKLVAAIECYQRALALNPSYIDALNGLGNALRTQGQLTDAITCYQRVLSLNPTSVEAHFNLGVVFREQYQLTEAVACYQRALQLNPKYVYAHINLGDALSEQGQGEEAITHYQRALELEPTYAEVHSNVVYTMNFLEKYDTATIFSAHQQFNIQQALPFATAIKPHLNDRNPQRRLKTGYLSPDFRKHALAYFIESVLDYHDHQQFEIFCYYNNTIVDQVTQHFQQYADHWRNCVGWSDEDLARRIREDGIDILVDLAGHTDKNRLLVFARHPAPVQVTYLGYPSTTGLSSIDYRITDGYADPEDITKPFNSEIPVRMPHSYFCYRPEKTNLSVNKLPAFTQGYITFGSFNNYGKINPPLMELWAEVLHAVPHSKFLIKGRSLEDPPTRQAFQDHFMKLGITTNRLTILDFVALVPDHLEKYHQIDISLDTYPYNGATTTCEALWMGVPVVTLVGERHVSRMGLSILSTIGLTPLITYTPEDYVNTSIQLANDLAYLQTLRATLRERMQTSPLMGGISFTRHVEVAYRKMWEKWCTSA